MSRKNENTKGPLSMKNIVLIHPALMLRVDQDYIFVIRMQHHSVQVKQTKVEISAKNLDIDLDNVWAQ